MVIKNSQLSDAVLDSLKDLLDIDLSVKMAWKISVISKKLEELVVLKNENANKIIKKYSQLDEEGNYIPAKDEDGKDIPNTTKIDDVESYTKDMNELNDIETKVDFNQIKIKDLGDNTIKPITLFNLHFIFKD